MTREEAKLIGVTTVPNKGLEYVWYENYLKKIDEIYDSLEQRNTELEQRIKELEYQNKIGFQALHCGQCQGGGCPVCGGSGFVFGKTLKATYYKLEQN